MIAFFYTAINTVKYITVEKERQLKETMKIMGLSSWLHWSAWFVKCILLLMVSISLITALLCANLTTNSELAVFEYADWSAVWIYLFVFSVTSICYCFMMSTIFTKGKSIGSGMIWAGEYILGCIRYKSAKFIPIDIHFCTQLNTVLIYL